MFIRCSFLLPLGAILVVGCSGGGFVGGVAATQQSKDEDSAASTSSAASDDASGDQETEPATAAVSPVQDPEVKWTEKGDGVPPNGFVTPGPVAERCGDGCVKLCGTKIQFTNHKGFVTGGKVTLSGARADVDLVSDVFRRAYVTVEADAGCSVSVKLRRDYPFMCHIQGGEICAPAPSPLEGGLAQNCFSPIYYSVNGAPRVHLPPTGYEVFTHSDGAQRPCPESSSCSVVGGMGAMLFNGSLDMIGCAAKCAEFADHANRTCTYAGKYNVKQ